MSSRLETANKNTLAKPIAIKMGLTIPDVTRMIDLLQEEIQNCIKENKRVQINGFLIFTPKNVKAKRMRSALDNKEYDVPARRDVFVAVGKQFKEYIKDGYTEAGETSNDDSSQPKRARKNSKHTA